MNNCLFCKIKTNDLPIKKIAENKNAIAFLDAFPISYGHCLVIPKNHYSNLSECDPHVLHDVIQLTRDVANKLENANLGIKGFNYLSNQNEIAGQVVMHFHVHIIPKYNEETGIKFNNNKIKNDPNLQQKIESLIIK